MNHWRALTRYMEDGRIEIDNNAAERALQGVALSLKNYLFLGSNAGGERAASLYSLLGSARLNEINPETYSRRCLPYAYRRHTQMIRLLNLNFNLMNVTY